MSDRLEQLAGRSPAPRGFMANWWALAEGQSIRTKILGIVVALVIVLGAGGILQVRATLRVVLSNDLQSRGSAIANHLATVSAERLLVGDLYGVQRLLQKTRENNIGVTYSFITSPQGEVLAHTFGESFPTALISANRGVSEESFRLQKLSTSDGVIWDFAVPIMDGRVGVARVGLSERAIQATSGDVTRELLQTTVVVSLLVLAAAVFLTYLIVRPVRDLVDVTRAVSRGDLSVLAESTADDELGRLSRAINEMIGDLAEARRRSEKFNLELLRRNRELDTLNSVAQLVNIHRQLDTVLDRVLEHVLDFLNLNAGWIVLFEDDGTRSHLVSSFGHLEPVSRQGSESDCQNCQCGKVAAEKRPEFIEAVNFNCPMFLRISAEDEYAAGCYSFPLVSKSRVIGLLNIGCTEANRVSSDDLNTLEVLGQHLGVAVENVRLRDEVQQNDAARGFLLEKIINVQEEERKRIARELHDGTSQSLTSLMVGLKVLGSLSEPEEIEQHLADLREIASETLDVVHDLALELRPSILDDLGLAAAINRYVTDYQRRFETEVDIRIIGFKGRRLPSVIETALYRIIQESLTNVARHAQAKHASVLLERTGQQVRAIVEDNGRGFDVLSARQERSLGLFGMEERAVLIGGTLRVETRPGLGTTVVIYVPIPEDSTEISANSESGVTRLEVSRAAEEMKRC